MAMNYAWIIDEDHLDGEGTGTTGPRDAPAELLTKLTGTSEGDKFRMYDDDEELYYSGRLLGDDPSLFEPLDDYGTPNAGCTEIRYRNDEKGVWETL